MHKQVEQSKIIIITDTKSKYVCACVFWGFFLGDSRGCCIAYIIWFVPLICSKSNCVQRQFCLRPMAVHPEMKRVCKGARLIVSCEL